MRCGGRPEESSPAGQPSGFGNSTPVKGPQLSLGLGSRSSVMLRASFGLLAASSGP